MKKLILLLLPLFSFSQEISPYYPIKQDNAYRGYEPTQLTYYSSDYVQGTIANFLDRQMMMTQIDVKADVKSKSYTQIYQDKFSDGKLMVTLNYDVIDAAVTNPEIIKSLKITGSRMSVLGFYVRFWHTKMKFEDITADVERNHLQDKVKLFFNNGKPYITITNTTYPTSKDFTAHYNKLLSEKPVLHN